MVLFAALITTTSTAGLVSLIFDFTGSSHIMETGTSFSLGIGSNIRKSPYFDATVADGVQSFSVYNHMYIPGHFGDPQGEYERLINAVAMWDVGAQRQVELQGPDATQLVQYLCARDVSGTAIGQGRYVPICNHDGNLINDPVLLFDQEIPECLVEQMRLFEVYGV